MGIRDKPIAPGSPWQNGFAERLIGSIRRECLDHFVVWGEAHLRRILQSYIRYYNNIRTHRSLDKDAPVSRAVQRIGSINSYPVLAASINSSSLARLMCVESCKCRARSAVGPRASPARRIRSAALLEILGIDRSFASRRTATASDDQGAGTECARSSGRNRGPVFA